VSYRANEFSAGSTYEHLQGAFGTANFSTQVMAAFCFETFDGKT